MIKTSEANRNSPLCSTHSVKCPLFTGRVDGEATATDRADKEMKSNMIHQSTASLNIFEWKKESTKDYTPLKKSIASYSFISFDSPFHKQHKNATKKAAIFFFFSPANKRKWNRSKLLKLEEAEFLWWREQDCLQEFETAILSFSFFLCSKKRNFEENSLHKGISYLQQQHLPVHPLLRLRLLRRYCYHQW